MKRLDSRRLPVLLLAGILCLVPMMGCSRPAGGPITSSGPSASARATSPSGGPGETVTGGETGATKTTSNGKSQGGSDVTKGNPGGSDSASSWSFIDNAEKVTVKDGYSYAGLKANSKNSSLPKSPSQYTGDIVLVENLEKYLPEGDVGYDIGFLLLALQGLANRDKPSLFLQRNGFSVSGTVTNKTEDWVNNINEDMFWLSYLTSSGQYLEKAKIQNWSAVTGTALCKALLEKFMGCYRGLVVWDPKVNATSLVAATIAGADNLLPVRYSTAPASLYVFLKDTLKLPVKVDLNGRFTGKKGAKIPDTSLPSTGSAKNDAYLWAKVKYLDAGKTSANWMGVIPDAAAMPAAAAEKEFPIYRRTIRYSADFLISQKAFMFDLCAFSVMLPYDDPDQEIGTDYNTFNQLLASQYKRAGGKIINVEGWPTWKTGLGKGNNYSGTEEEFQYIKLLSQYNARGECDARAMNTSLYRHVPEGTYKQKASKTVNTSKYDPNKKYVMFYCGDYDSTGWLQEYLPHLWENDARGSIPLAWGINGSQAESCKLFFNYMYQTATPNDWFVSGNNGGGYLNPISLQPEKKDAKYARKLVPDGLEMFKAVCIGLNKKYDLDASPRLIMTNGMWNDTILKAYADIAPAGFGYWNYDKANPLTVTGSAGTPVPYVRYYEAITNLDSKEKITDYLKEKLAPSVSDTGKGMVIVPATIVSPGLLKNVVDDLHSQGLNFEVVGPYDFFAYAKMRA